MKWILLKGLFVETFEWWSVILGGISLALGVFGWGFARWSNTVSKMAQTFDERLALMTKRDDERWDEIKDRMTKQEDKFSELQLCVERRVTKLEAFVRRE